MKTLYADNAATTQVRKSVINAMLPYMYDNFGNPSSSHSMGRAAAMAIAKARQTIADVLGASENEIYFTSGGSEADNQAIISCAYEGIKYGKRHIVSTEIEHHAVLNTLKMLEHQGFEVTLIHPEKDTGMITAEQVEDAIRPDTCLVSVMYANNEIGTILPIREIGAVCKLYGIPFHTDAVQAAGHLHINVDDDNIDLLSLSAHKFGGLKGVGVLYAREGLTLTSLINGGEQEKGKRAGTENVPGIVGMAVALKESVNEIDTITPKLTRMRDRLINGLLEIPGTVLNGSVSNRLPSNVNVCFEDIEGESLVALLDNNGICASTGSACTTGSLDPSHVLLAIGRSEDLARGSLRFSINSDFAEEDIDYVITTVKKLLPFLTL